MRRIDFARAAVADLTSIRSYIAERNPQAAARVAARLAAACVGLGMLSGRGRPGRIPGTRELASVRPYVIVYQEGEGRVTILRVWHGAQSRQS